MSVPCLLAPHHRDYSEGGVPCNDFLVDQYVRTYKPVVGLVVTAVNLPPHESDTECEIR